MREFKFRIWDKPVETMYQDSGRFYVTADGEVYDVNDDFDISDQVVLMQYTGFKDKKGIEIYEGDVIQEDLDNWGLVVFDENGMFSVKMHGIGPNEMLVDFLSRGRIIGNIYENPDILD